jgi:hypothetical protein
MKMLQSIVLCSLGMIGCSSGPVVARYPVHCFQGLLDDGSVISLQYIEYIGEVIGVLDYAFEQKDSAYGTFTGSLVDNVITAKWNYTVEGAHQEEVILIRVDADNAYRAHGELVVGKEGVLSLVDTESVTWSDVMYRVSCDGTRFR